MMKLRIGRQDFVNGNRVMILCFIIACFVNSIIESLSHRNVLEPFRHMEVFLYNSFLIFATFSLVIFIRRRAFGHVLLALLWLALGFVNFLLQSFRVTPFTAVDFKLIKYGIRIADVYLSWLEMLLISLLAAAILGGCIWMWRKLPVAAGRVAYPIGMLYVTAVLTVLVILTNDGIRRGYLADSFGNIAAAYHDYGFAYCFSASVIATGIERPEDYNEEIIEEIYLEELVEEDRGTAILTGAEKGLPDIIFIQLESFFDPTLLNDIAFSKDPIPYFRSLQARYSTGYLSVPSVGAGTANTEFEVITGMNLDFFGPGEYPYKTILQKSVCESIAFNLKELGYRAHAVHNNEGTFYDRHKVFSQLGFDTFTSIEYMEGIERNPTGWARDGILTDEIRKILDASNDEGSFIYGISVQGHGAYPDEALLKNPEIRVNGDGVEDIRRKNQVEYFVNQLYEMDCFIEELVEALEKRAQGYVLVMYGDHLPTLEITPKELANGSIFQTEYVMVSNLNLPKKDQDIKAYQLTAYVLEQLQIHTGTMVRYHQKYLLEGGDEASYLESMKILEYDMLYGGYEVYGKELPFEATQMQMGIDQIAIGRVLEKDGNLHIYGTGFNDYSHVFINDKAAAAILQPDKSLKVEYWDGRDEAIITIRQIGNDRVVLSETDTFCFIPDNPVR